MVVLGCINVYLSCDYFFCCSCEADPGALAKYVIALVKKDKSPEVLRESMISQLEVFLQNGKLSETCLLGHFYVNNKLFYFTETEPFVNLLFKTLETQDYITPVIPNTNPPNPNIKSDLLPVKSNKVESVKEIKPIIPVSELPNLSETVNGSSAAAKKDVEIKRDREIRKSDSVSLILLLVLSNIYDVVMVY